MRVGLPRATIKNLKKFEGLPGLIQFSPFTREEYSATYGDYFHLYRKPNYLFHDSDGNPMYLVLKLRTRRARKGQVVSYDLLHPVTGKIVG